MAEDQLRSVIRQLRCLVGAQEGVRFPSDSQLLDAFIQSRDEAAFEILVWRHGKMVLNLCRRVLHDEHWAEDAFQATFLIFVRKARSISKRQSIGSWLHRVAYRVSQRLRSRLSMRLEQRADADDLDSFPADCAADDLIWRDLRPVLDEEIDRLPEKFRVPIVLCYLQGLTNEEAAELLGCPKGTILSRLSRGREQLRSKLVRRGLTLPVGWLALYLPASTSASTVPNILAHSTIKAAREIALGKMAGVAVSRTVALLTRGVLHTMFMTKLKIAAISVLAVVALTMGIVSIVQLALANPQQRQANFFTGDFPLPTKEAPKNLSELQPDMPPSPLPKEIVAAWHNAGAQAGWMGPTNYMGMRLFAESFRPGRQGMVEEVPCFRVWSLPAFALDQLPQPNQAFGLDIIADRQQNRALMQELVKFKYLLRLKISGGPTDADLKDLTALKNLQSLSIASGEVTDIGMKELAKLSSLQTLRIQQFQRVTDAGFKELAELKELRDLCIHAPISDVVLKHLTGLTKLQSLTVPGFKVSDNGFKELAKLKELRELVILGPVTDAGIEVLSELKELRSLGLLLVDTTLPENGLKKLARLKELRSLHIQGKQITDAGFQGLSRFKSLQTLSLISAQVTDAGICSELAALKSLRTLNLASRQITDIGLKELAGLNALQVLNLSGTQVTDDGLKVLSGFNNLHTLELKKTRISDEGLKSLIVLKKLRTIELEECIAVTDGGMKYLAELKDLQNLNLDSTRVTDPGIKHLTGLKHLEVLNLYNTKVTDAALRDLAELKNLQELHLSDTKVTRKGIAELKRTLPTVFMVTYN